MSPPRWNTADLLIQCFPGQGPAQLQYFAFSCLAFIVIVLFTFGWPLLTYLTLKHLFEQHAVVVQESDLPPDERSAIIKNNRPAQSEEDRCARQGPTDAVMRGYKLLAELMYPTGLNASFLHVPIRYRF